jgi:hypothetical protein
MSEQPTDPQSLPGCGFAAYAVLLIVFGILGMVGMGSATLSMMQAAQEVGPAKLMPGNEVAVWQMAPMRKAGLVGLTEVPLAWHDESPVRDGTTACALMDDRLIKVEEGAGTTLRYADLAEVVVEDNTLDGHVVTARGRTPDGEEAEIVCRFAMNEGGPKMGRQLQAEQRRAAGAAPASEERVDGGG